ncbi:MAG: serine hydroxymethyltransferase, partial [Ruminococcaceae bacterium]|nr:serine hydroxymethyltransferase [Oscillospiraceae bacterium]
MFNPDSVTKYLIEADPELGSAVASEFARQRRNIELIASENFVSPAVLAAAST